MAAWRYSAATRRFSGSAATCDSSAARLVTAKTKEEVRSKKLEAKTSTLEVRIAPIDSAAKPPRTECPAWRPEERVRQCFVLSVRRPPRHDSVPRAASSKNFPPPPK